MCTLITGTIVLIYTSDCPTCLQIHVEQYVWIAKICRPYQTKEEVKVMYLHGHVMKKSYFLYGRIRKMWRCFLLCTRRKCEKVKKLIEKETKLWNQSVSSIITVVWEGSIDQISWDQHVPPFESMWSGIKNFFYLLDMCVTNSYTMHKEAGGNRTLGEFKLEHVKNNIFQFSSRLPTSKSSSFRTKSIASPRLSFCWKNPTTWKFNQRVL